MDAAHHDIRMQARARYKTAKFTTGHRHILLIATFASRILVVLVILLASNLPLFDSSPRVLLLESSWTAPLLRWDAFHFAHIAKDGYTYEHEWAFFPGTPLVMKYSGALIQSGGWAAVLQGGALVVLLCDTTFVLYDLSLYHLRDETLAFLAAFLSLIPSSPATLRYAPYTESFFTYLSYRGMLECTKARWFMAASYFCLAAGFRSNGILLSGFIIWGLLVEPLLQQKKLPLLHIPYTAFLTIITLIPFVLHQSSAYRAFCNSPTPAPWCTNFPPSIYTYVQSKYWNVGFLRYWTVSQIPNFLLASPVLLLLSYSSTHHITYNTVRLYLAGSKQLATSPFTSPSLTPHAIHAFILTATLLFASHTQIILRLAASMPFTYWSAARLLVERPMWGKLWIGWSIVWSFVSLVLWSAFLPPA